MAFFHRWQSPTTFSLRLSLSAAQFLAASGYALPVREKESWHSAPKTTEADGERLSIMLTYYVEQAPQDEGADAARGNFLRQVSEDLMGACGREHQARGMSKQPTL